MIWRCDLTPQYERFAPQLADCLRRVGESGRYILADEVKAFEREYAAYLGVKRVVGVANGTDALILIMKALGIGAGDEVITTAYTAIPTVSAIIAVGATPVFVDIEPDTFLMDISQVRAAITERTRAIMPVHLFGNVVPIPELAEAAAGIPIIEDACQAHGSSYRGARAGSMGIASAFSFYPTKNLGGVGDGGAIATNDEELADRLVRLRMYGMVDKDHIEQNGVNSRLDELQAAFLRVKLKCLDDMNEQRRAIAARYKAGLTGARYGHQALREGVTPNYHVYTLRYGGDRDALVAYLEKHGIQTNVYYPLPLHLQRANAFLGYRRGDLPITEALCGQAIAIAMYPELPEDTQQLIIERINAFNG